MSLTRFIKDVLRKPEAIPESYLRLLHPDKSRIATTKGDIIAGGAYHSHCPPPRFFRLTCSASR
jgi:hypothetical protein